MCGPHFSEVMTLTRCWYVTSDCLFQEPSESRR